jgi:uncharacterized protein (TIGR02594 family)
VNKLNKIAVDVFYGDNGKFSITALVAVFAVIVNVTVFIYMLLGYTIPDAIFTYALGLFDGAVFARVVQRGAQFVGTGLGGAITKNTTKQVLEQIVASTETVETPKKEPVKSTPKTKPIIVVPKPAVKQPEKSPPTQKVEVIGKNILAARAKYYIGVREFAGSEHNPTIISWLQKLGWNRTHAIVSDETPWCSLFVNAVCLEVGLPYSDSPRAKSWLSVGMSVSLDDVLKMQPNKNYGLVAIYHRGQVSRNENEGSGHVNIVDSVAANGTFTTIGGNESDTVKLGRNSVKDRMFIGFRLIT